MFCYLREHGVLCDYNQLLTGSRDSKGAPNTASKLIQIAREHDIDLCPVRLTMRELYSCQLPIIVHIDGDTPESGAFLLVHSISDKSIAYMNGPTASLHAIDIESFRRIWSGIGLVPISHASNKWHAFAGGACIGLVLFWVARVLRLWRQVGWQL